MAKGKRLTCPVCKDSSFFSFEQIKMLENLKGTIQCDGSGAGRHHVRVEMVDLVGLYEILGRGEPLTEEEEVDLDVVVEAGLIHPDDFEFEDWAVEFERDLI